MISSRCQRDVEVHIEDGVQIGSPVIAKLKCAWVGTRYVYGKVKKTAPLSVVSSQGTYYSEKDLVWVVLAEDDGWLAPYGLDWQKPGRPIVMQLMNQEWVSARIAAGHRPQRNRAGLSHLEIEGIDGLKSVCIQTDVALLLTPHEDCLEEFGHAQPCRGGRLHEHIANAFALEQPAAGESRAEAECRQRQRWVKQSRTDGQYPIRSVWVHPQVKEGALNEFARRAALKKQECPFELEPEVVMVMGPPAAGKSSASRLQPDQLTGHLKPLRQTVASLKYREEVNNDNLTDCMPGFALEYRRALAIKKSYHEDEPSPAKNLWHRAKLGVDACFTSMDLASRLQWMAAMQQAKLTAESWALQWLTYLVYHHGPVRDSLALDVIKVTVIDAKELPVYYSSCMAGKAMGRTMKILELAHSATKPIYHRRLPFRGFWPYTSQESRLSRQTSRALEEQAEGKLKGGNVTSNLVDIHYHAQQAETNITKLLGCLRKGVKPSDDTNEVEESTLVAMDHFLVIDNERDRPHVLLDFLDDCSQSDIHETVNDSIQQQLLATVESIIARRNLFQKKWDAFDPHLFRIMHFFIRICCPQGHHLREKAAELVHQMVVSPLALNANEVLQMVVEIDEQLFFRMYGKTRTPATDTRTYRSLGCIGPDAENALRLLSDDDVDHMKKSLSVMRKYTCLAVMQDLKGPGTWQDAMISATRSMGGKVVEGVEGGEGFSSRVQERDERLQL